MSDPDPILTVAASRQAEFAEEASGVIRLPVRWWRQEHAADQTHEPSVAAAVPLSAGGVVVQPSAALSPGPALAPPGAEPDPGPEAA